MAFPSNPIYKLVNHPISGELLNIRTATDDFIPIDEDNTDYQNIWSGQRLTPQRLPTK